MSQVKYYRNKRTGEIIAVPIEPNERIPVDNNTQQRTDNTIPIVLIIVSLIGIIFIGARISISRKKNKDLIKKAEEKYKAEQAEIENYFRENPDKKIDLSSYDFPEEIIES